MQAWTVHGGRLSDACRVYGGTPDDWLDLSTGINPRAWPGCGAIAIDWRALPDEAGLAALEAAAAAHFGVAAAHVCALPGSEIGLRLLGTLPIAGDPVHVAPAYRSHGAAFGGIAPIGADALADAVGQGRTVLLANPNNPDGRIIPRDDLLAAARRLAATGLQTGRAAWLIVDEAFADAMPWVSVAPEVRDDLPLLVLRSFGKFFGLAGLRLGFAVGPRAMIARLRERLGSWPVSSAALAIGAAAYRDADWIAAMRETLAADAARLDGVLARHGLPVIGACPLFRLVETRDAGALFERLARSSILARPFDYDPRWLRLGLPGDAAALERLDRALAA